MAAGPAGGAGRDAGRRPGRAGAVDGRHDQAGHAGDDPAGRALGARAGHRRAARRRLPRHAAAAAHRLAGAPHAAVRAEPGGRAGRPGAVRADRAGRRGGMAVRAAGRRVGHHRRGRGVLPGRGAAAGSGGVRAGGERAARRHRAAPGAHVRRVPGRQVGTAVGTAGRDGTSRAVTPRALSWAATCRAAAWPGCQLQARPSAATWPVASSVRSASASWAASGPPGAG